MRQSGHAGMSSSGVVVVFVVLVVRALGCGVRGLGPGPVHSSPACLALPGGSARARRQRPLAAAPHGAPASAVAGRQLKRGRLPLTTAGLFRRPITDEYRSARRSTQRPGSMPYVSPPTAIRPASALGQGRGGGAGLRISPTWTGGLMNSSTVRNRLLNGTPPRGTRRPTKGVVQRVNEKRAGRGRMLLPARVTPHTLRRTFASLCFLAGARPALDDGTAGTRRSPHDPWCVRAVHDAQPGRRGGGLAAHALHQRSRDAPRRAEVWSREWSYDDINAGASGLTTAWARRVSNLRPLACEASALPLSYAPLPCNIGICG